MPSYDQVMLKHGYRKITPAEYQEALGKPNELIFLWHRVDGFDHREESNPVSTTDLNQLLNSARQSIINNWEDDSTSETTLSVRQSVIAEEWPAHRKYLQKATINDCPLRYRTSIVRTCS